MAARTLVGTGSLNASVSANWNGGTALADGDSITIATNQILVWDLDTTAWTVGVAGISIAGHATTPGQLTFPTTAGTYLLMVKAGSAISGTNLAVYGRLYIGSVGTPQPANATVTIRHKSSSTGPLINATYLDIKIYCNEPTDKYVCVPKNGGPRQSCSWVGSTEVITCNGHGFYNGTPRTPVRWDAAYTVPAPCSANTTYYINYLTANTFSLYTAESAGSQINITSDGSGGKIYKWGERNGATVIDIETDVTAQTAWYNGATVAVCKANRGPAAQVGITISSISSSTITLGTALSTIAMPGSVIALITRNVQLLGYFSGASTATYTAIYYPNATYPLYIAAEIRNLYGSNTVNNGNGIYGSGSAGGATLKGSISNFNSGTYAFTSTGTPLTIDAAIVYNYSHGIASMGNATITGCIAYTYGSYGGMYSCSCCYINNHIAGCSSYGIYNANHCYIKATLFGNDYTCTASTQGCVYDASCILDGNGAGASGTILTDYASLISGIIRNGYTGLTCTAGACLSGVTMSGNTNADILTGNAPIIGYACSLNSSTQVGAIGSPYVGKDMEWVEMWEIGNAANAYKKWQYWGTIASQAVALGAKDYSYLFTFAYTGGLLFMDIPVRVPVGTTTATVNMQKSGTGYTTTPYISFIEPDSDPRAGGTALSTATMADDTNLQSLSVNYVATSERTIFLRIAGQNASGTLTTNWTISFPGGGTSGAFFGCPF